MNEWAVLNSSDRIVNVVTRPRKRQNRPRVSTAVGPLLQTAITYTPSSAASDAMDGVIGESL